MCYSLSLSVSAAYWTIQPNGQSKSNWKKRVDDDTSHTAYDIQSDNSVGVVVVLIRYFTQYSCNDTNEKNGKKNIFTAKKSTLLLIVLPACNVLIHIYFALIKIWFLIITIPTNSALQIAISCWHIVNKWVFFCNNLLTICFMALCLICKSRQMYFWNFDYIEGE